MSQLIFLLDLNGKGLGSLLEGVDGACPAIYSSTGVVGQVQ